MRQNLSDVLGEQTQEFVFDGSQMQFLFSDINAAGGVIDTEISVCKGRGFGHRIVLHHQPSLCDAQPCQKLFHGEGFGKIIVRSRIERLNRLEKMEENGEFDLLPKKEVLGLKKEMTKLEANLGGIKEMKTLPGAMFVVDPHNEDIAVQEARKLHIPIIAITDTNCDPDLIDYVIPGNDDAIRAVKLLSSVIANAVIEANQGEAVNAEMQQAAAEVAAEPSIEEVVEQAEEAAAPAEEAPQAE